MKPKLYLIIFLPNYFKSKMYIGIDAIVTSQAFKFMLEKIQFSILKVYFHNNKLNVNK